MYACLSVSQTICHVYVTFYFVWSIGRVLKKLKHFFLTEFCRLIFENKRAGFILHKHGTKWILRVQQLWNRSWAISMLCSNCAADEYSSKKGFFHFVQLEFVLCLFNDMFNYILFLLQTSHIPIFFWWMSLFFSTDTFFSFFLLTIFSNFFP